MSLFTRAHGRSCVEFCNKDVSISPPQPMELLWASSTKPLFPTPSWRKIWKLSVKGILFRISSFFFFCQSMQDLFLIKRKTTVHFLKTLPKYPVPMLWFIIWELSFTPSTLKFCVNLLIPESHRHFENYGKQSQVTN